MKIEKKLTLAMNNAFSSTSDRKKAIHFAAVAGAAIVAVLPIGIDAWVLRLAEIIMVICIASSYGEKLTKSAAKGLFLSSFAQLAGESLAFASLEALEITKVASSPTGVGPAAAYAVKTTIAVSLIETVGHMVIAYYEKPDGVGSKLCTSAEGIGAVADVMRLVMATSDAIDAQSDQQLSSSSASKKVAIPFTGSNVDPDLLKRIEEAERKVKQYQQYLQSDVIHGYDTSTNSRNLKYWLDVLKSLRSKL